MFVHPIPYQPDATAYYAALHDLPYPIWLDSAGRARFDILTAAPHQHLTLQHFDELRPWLNDKLPAQEHIPFAGGAMGYWAYDDEIHAISVGIYDWALVLDHHRKIAQLVSFLRFPETTALLATIQQRLNSVATLAIAPFSVTGKIISNFTMDSYATAFNRIQHYLRAGDCYQVNLAQRFHANCYGDALAAYLQLRQFSPAPYSAFLNFPNIQILSASPECFLRVSNQIAISKPIKGTRPRGQTVEQDEQLMHDLRHHPKDRAENLMIVDLLRNDLNKNCIPGSVQAPKLFDIESYSNVHHLVSTITGKLIPNRDALDLLRDSFPGGSITGAPKRRAQQIIQELEPDPRSIYCGAIGYIGFDGSMDTNIAIRTLVHHNQQIRCWAGGGIVADSNCQQEYQETFDKASAMLKLMQHFGGKL